MKRIMRCLLLCAMLAAGGVFLAGCGGGMSAESRAGDLNNAVFGAPDSLTRFDAR